MHKRHARVQWIVQLNSFNKYLFLKKRFDNIRRRTTSIKLISLVGNGHYNNISLGFRVFVIHALHFGVNERCMSVKTRDKLDRVENVQRYTSICHEEYKIKQQNYKINH